MDFLEFVKNNPLFILIPLLFAVLMFLNPFRRFISYCAKNIIPAVFYVLMSFLFSSFGFNLPLNIFSLASALLLGLPGISLALFAELII
jgi:hypothetical protein